MNALTVRLSSLAPPLSFALTAKGGRFDGESETFIVGEVAGSIPTHHGIDAQAAWTDRLIAFAQNCRDEVRDLKDLAGALAAEPGMKQQTYLAMPVAFDERNITSKANRSNPQPGDPCHTLHSFPPTVTARWGVRRLLPIECERCQGMPDHWTRYGIDDKGNEYELSDSARYRLIGNSVAVPNVAWIGRRIVAASEQH